jgi:hypothetical protein
MIISKRPPYEKTSADPERTEMQINKLLSQYGISKYAWTKDLKNNQVALTFETEMKIEQREKTIQIKVVPPTFAILRRTWNAEKGYYEKMALPNWAQSYRLLYHWLKAKLEAIAYGLTTVEQEFLSQVVVALPDGRSSTIGAILMEKGVLVSGQFALEEKTQGGVVTEARIIEKPAV